MNAGTLDVIISANSASFQSEINKANQKVNELATTSAKASNKMSGLFTGIASGLTALGLSKVFGAISNSMGSAIKRFDTLNNYPRVMSNLGIGAEESKKSIQRLVGGLEGLPTTLNDGATAVQRFTSANGNIKASTEMFLALNNAVLAGGASAEIQSSALEQLSQSYSKGKPDMMEWRTAMTAMPAQMKQVAQAMGYMDANQLGEALRSGKASMNDFMLTLVKLNKEGINGFGSFEEQARNATGGISTSMTNIQTAITRGITEVMNAIGQSNIASFFTGIAKAINAVIPYIVGFVKVVGWAINAISGLFGKKNNVGGIAKQSDTTTKSLNNLGGSGNKASKGIDKATGSAKKLKKELIGLAGFDQMNVLKENDNAGGGSGSNNLGSADGGVGGLGNMDLSSFDNALTKTSNKADEIAEHIKAVLSSIWNSEPIKVFVEAIQTYFGFLKDYWSSIGISFIENASLTWNSVSENVQNALNNIVAFWNLFWSDISSGIKKWGAPFINSVIKLFNSIWFDAVDPLIQLVTKNWEDFSKILLELWQKHGQPLIDNIGMFATNTIELFRMIWDMVINPIIKPFLEEMGVLWDKHISKLIKEIGDFIMSLVNGALEIYNVWILPIINWITKKLEPAWTMVWSTISGVFGTVVGFISDSVGGIIKIFRGIIDFITGIFTGNWKKAWEGVKTIFTSIFEGIKTAFKLPINLIIDGINGFTAGLNKIKIPEWVPIVGGKGFHIAKIPKLAKGGIVDRPTYSLIGEAGKEAVVPLENNTGWITQLASKIQEKTNNKGDNSRGNQPIYLTINLGDKKIYDGLIKELNNRQFETNGGFEVYA